MYRIVGLFMVVSLVGVLWSCASPAPSAVADQRAVAEVLSDYRAAWLANDEARVMRHVAEDFTLFPPGATSKTVVGKRAVEGFWFPASDTVYRITTYDISDQQLHVSGDLAVEQGTSVLAWDTVFRDSVLSTSRSTNEYLTVLRREAGGWKLSRSMHVPR